MANEKRLVNAEAIARKLKYAHCSDCHVVRQIQCSACWVGDVLELLESDTVDAVEVPCKVGSLVWGIKRFNRGQKAIQSVVTQMYFGDNMRLGIVVKGVCHGEWGKNVFATEEEALAKIDGERKDNERKAD